MGTIHAVRNHVRWWRSESSGSTKENHNETEDITSYGFVLAGALYRRMPGGEPNAGATGTDRRDGSDR
jgi:hypothetical protein